MSTYDWPDEGTYVRAERLDGSGAIEGYLTSVNHFMDVAYVAASLDVRAQVEPDFWRITLAEAPSRRLQDGWYLNRASGVWNRIYRRFSGDWYEVRVEGTGLIPSKNDSHMQQLSRLSLLPDNR